MAQGSLKTVDDIKDLVRAFQKHLPKKCQKPDEDIDSFVDNYGTFDEYLKYTKAELCAYFEKVIGFAIFNRLHRDPQVPLPTEATPVAPPPPPQPVAIAVGTGHKAKVPILKDFGNKVTPWTLAVRAELKSATFPTEEAKVYKAAEGLTNGSMEKNKWLILDETHAAKQTLEDFFEFVRKAMGQSADTEADDKKAEFHSIQQRKGELLLDYMNRIEVLKDEILKLDGTDYSDQMVRRF